MDPNNQQDMQDVEAYVSMILDGEFMLGRNVAEQFDYLTTNSQLAPLHKRLECNDQIVMGVDLQEIFIFHGSGPCPGVM